MLKYSQSGAFPWARICVTIKSMPWVKCKICNKDFYAKPRHIRMGWGKYCSRVCSNKGALTGKDVGCGTCGKRIYRSQKELRASKSQNYYCGRSCFAIWKNSHLLIGEKHVNWKSGVNAYRAIMARADISPICSGCGFEDRRVLVVHHKDKDRQNNHLENLVWLCRNCHYLEHDGKTI